MIAIVILAAGASTRLGSPKQLLPLGNEPALKHIVRQALGTRAPVWVVLGEMYHSISELLVQLPVQVLHNPDWSRGMASSIQAGVQAIQSHQADCRDILLMTADQIMLHTDDLALLMATHQARNAPITVSHYHETYGIPAIFHRQMWASLLALQGDTGARKIIYQHLAQANIVEMPTAAYDIDTPEDYARVYPLWKRYFRNC